MTPSRCNRAASLQLGSRAARWPHLARAPGKISALHCCTASEHAYIYLITAKLIDNLAQHPGVPMAAPQAANLQALTRPQMFVGISTALAAPLAFVVEAFADAWGFPAAAMVTVLNADGSQSAVPASELSVGSQVRAATPWCRSGVHAQLFQPLHVCSMAFLCRAKANMEHAQHTEIGAYKNRC